MKSTIIRFHSPQPCRQITHRPLRVPRAPSLRSASSGQSVSWESCSADHFVIRHACTQTRRKLPTYTWTNTHASGKSCFERCLQHSSQKKKKKNRAVSQTAVLHPRLKLSEKTLFSSSRLLSFFFFILALSERTDDDILAVSAGGDGELRPAMDMGTTLRTGCWSPV